MTAGSGSKDQNHFGLLRRNLLCFLHDAITLIVGSSLIIFCFLVIFTLLLVTLRAPGMPNNIPSSYSEGNKTICYATHTFTLYGNQSSLTNASQISGSSSSIIGVTDFPFPNYEIMHCKSKGGLLNVGASLYIVLIEEPLDHYAAVWMIMECFPKKELLRNGHHRKLLKFYIVDRIFSLFAFFGQWYWQSSPMGTLYLGSYVVLLSAAFCMTGLDDKLVLASEVTNPDQNAKLLDKAEMDKHRVPEDSAIQSNTTQSPSSSFTRTVVEAFVSAPSTEERIIPGDKHELSQTAVGVGRTSDSFVTAAKGTANAAVQGRGNVSMKTIRSDDAGHMRGSKSALQVPALVWATNNTSDARQPSSVITKQTNYNAIKVPAPILQTSKEPAATKASTFIVWKRRILCIITSLSASVSFFILQELLMQVYKMRDRGEIAEADRMIYIFMPLFVFLISLFIKRCTAAILRTGSALLPDVFMGAASSPALFLQVMVMRTSSDDDFQAFRLFFSAMLASVSCFVSLSWNVFSLHLSKRKKDNAVGPSSLSENVTALSSTISQTTTRTEAEYTRPPAEKDVALATSSKNDNGRSLLRQSPRGQQKTSLGPTHSISTATDRLSLATASSSGGSNLREANGSADKNLDSRPLWTLPSTDTVSSTPRSLPGGLLDTDDKFGSTGSRSRRLDRSRRLFREGASGYEIRMGSTLLWRSIVHSVLAGNLCWSGAGLSLSFFKTFYSRKVFINDRCYDPDMGYMEAFLRNKSLGIYVQEVFLILFGVIGVMLLSEYMKLGVLKSWIDCRRRLLRIIFFNFLLFGPLTCKTMIIDGVQTPSC